MIVLRGIEKSYPKRGGGETSVLRDIHLRIPRGSYAAFMGPSGSGKSTLMHILGCLDTPTAGQYLLDGTDVSRLGHTQLCAVRRDSIGFVFQGYQLMTHLTAEENAAFPLMLRGTDEAARSREALRALERVGLLDKAKHLPFELSGGQQQRVAFARAICAKPKLLLCDEPTGALDTDSRNAILDLLDSLHADGHTIALITHDPFVASRAKVRYRVANGGVHPVISAQRAAYPS